ncbi:glycosyltransferase family 4 protein [Flavobacterium sp.]|uniref:glycosyltransferase family 4 protein n=1 Tax=Flavobacterium sp. TaxID=239 RepID=UPI0026172D6E|nr:glycosyltransferase family 4 protein [Flavobacterium sp.]
MKNKKKIAILCNYILLPERVGGMDHFFWKFDATCKANNIQVDWFFPNRAQHGEYSSLTIFDSNHQSVESFFLDFCVQNRPDYTHVVTHFVELCTPFFKRLKLLSEAKVIAIDHNPRPIKGYPLKKKIEKKVKGFLYSKYIDELIGVSNYTVEEIINDFGFQLRSKTKTIYNGVISKDIKARSNRALNRPTFLVASHLRESKGIQDLIVAVQYLPLEIKNEIKIDIYGDGPYKNQLIEKIKKYQLEDCFSFKGNQSNLNEIFSQYDYMLQPTHMECFSLSILESLAANVPVITTNVGGNEEAVVDGSNGYVFKAKDTIALTAILEEVFLGKKKIHANTRIAIEDKFSLEKMVNEHFALLLNK